MGRAYFVEYTDGGIDTILWPLNSELVPGLDQGETWDMSALPPGMAATVRDELHPYTERADVENVASVTAAQDPFA